MSAAKVTGELLKLAEANPILAEFELDKREVFLTASLLRAPAECVAGAVANAMAMASKGGGSANSQDDAAPLSKRATTIARKYGINPNSPTSRSVLTNLDMTVEKFIATFRQARLRGEIPGEYLKMTVGDALESGNSTVRKFLFDGRFGK